MDFLHRIFGDNTGYLSLVVITGDKRTEHLLRYPDDLSVATDRARAWADRTGANVYFRPVLFDRADSSSAVVCAPVIAVDLDMVHPVLVTPRPDLIVESSAGRYQAYWLRNGHGDEFTPLSVNGPVTSGIELCRLPGTRNHKYSGGSWLVREIDPSSLDTHTRVAERRGLRGSTFDQLFAMFDVWSLARLCARLGCSAVETFVVLQAAQEASGARPGDDGHMTVGALHRDAVSAVAASGVPPLLDEDELRSAAAPAGSSFVDRYVEWATRCTDSPRQYHIAGALMVLSTILSPHVSLPTSFGEFRCNLWFVLLAGTTMTRKTTAMEMAVKLAEAVDPDIVLTTNGTGEGIISALSERDGHSALFHRDEISGFLAEATEKKYMTGMLESLTRLYDGGREKRTLRRHTVKVDDPYFQIMCGGIKSRTMELLDAEHVSSGFLPRFLMVCGWTRMEDMRPIGPPDRGSGELRAELVSYLDDLHKYYSPSARATKHRLTATPEAWDRMRRLESDVHDLGMRSDNPDAYCPLYERLMNSVIKVAVLLAADRSYREACEPVLEVRDLVTAISYADDVWVESMHEVARGIEDKPGKDEVRVLRVEKTIRDATEGVTRGEIMRRHRLSAREANEIEATLIGRGLVVATKVNKATVYRVATRKA